MPILFGFIVVVLLISNPYTAALIGVGAIAFGIYSIRVYANQRHNAQIEALRERRKRYLQRNGTLESELRELKKVDVRKELDEQFRKLFDR